VIPLLIILGALGVLYLANHGLALLIGIPLLLYLADCTFRPRITCRMCNGSGSIFKSGRRMAMCPLCLGRKQHTRIGARIWRRHRFMFIPDPEAEEDEERGPTMHDRGHW